MRSFKYKLKLFEFVLEDQMKMTSRNKGLPTPTKMFKLMTEWAPLIRKTSIVPKTPSLVKIVA